MADLVSQLQVVRADGKRFRIDRDDVSRIAALTGGTDEAHLVAVCRHYLDRAKGEVAKPGPFVVAAIRNDPDPSNYRYQRPSPTRAEECPKHPGQWPDNCRGCAADRLYGD